MQVNLKKNGWHRRLQLFVFEDAPRYGSLCPYFWFTVACLWLSPFVSMYRGLVWIVYKALDLLDACLSFIDNKFCQPVYQQQLLSTNETSLIKFLDGYLAYKTFYENEYKKNYEKFQDYKRAYIAKHGETAYLNHEAELRRKRAAEKEAMERAYEAAQLRKKEERALAEKRKLERQLFFENLIKYTKWLAPIFLSIVALGVLFGLFVLVVKLGEVIPTWDWEKILVTTGRVILVVAILVVAGFFIAGLVKLIAKCKLSIPSTDIRIKRPAFLGKISTFFKSVGDFIVMYAKAAKENYCPLIKWEE